ncbi:hypothetical protein QCA50_003702 [Cerrena zonata]|uniref:Uncharacterized protein n=1 Tax=Cerrena zonata TaxID=2478898 RepID=A0AAW0GWX1_9APHY
MLSRSVIIVGSHYMRYDTSCRLLVSLLSPQIPPRSASFVNDFSPRFSLLVPWILYIALCLLFARSSSTCRPTLYSATLLSPLCFSTPMYGYSLAFHPRRSCTPLLFCVGIFTLPYCVQLRGPDVDTREFHPLHLLGPSTLTPLDDDDPSTTTIRDVLSCCLLPAHIHTQTSATVFYYVVFTFIQTCTLICADGRIASQKGNLTLVPSLSSTNVFTLSARLTPT